MMIHESIIIYIDTQSWFSNHDDWFSVTKFIPNLSQSQSKWSSAPSISALVISAPQKITTEDPWTEKRLLVFLNPCRISKKMNHRGSLEKTVNFILKNAQSNLQIQWMNHHLSHWKSPVWFFLPFDKARLVLCSEHQLPAPVPAPSKGKGGATMDTGVSV